jgi:hypothetical protein
MNSKQLVKKLIKQIGNEYIIGGITDESLELAIKLAQSFETHEERLIRIKKFGDVTEAAIKAAAKYNRVVA